ncbi:RecX family transcriptional regulator [Bifidobacterium avesanii]|uniref:Regulatory protein RecX n=1 Tax=Bifidobacterium avesanii TaxID=1798157 RepID=A0A7K3TJG0_9BIFI|nr:RecX family transcriptional regulator [Bifidobacterium avesanii]
MPGDAAAPGAGLGVPPVGDDADDANAGGFGAGIGVIGGAFGADDDDRGRRGGRGGSGDRRTNGRGVKRRSPRRGGFASRGGAVAALAGDGGDDGPDDPRDADACREAALTLLDAAPRSSGALAQRLRDKGYAPDVADAVVARLIEVRLIDDEAYAQSVLRACVGRDLGARGAVQELARKGVDRDLAARAVAEASEHGVFEECAWSLGRQVAAKTAGLERDVRLRRFWAAGGRKGHNPETLRAVARELFA